MAQIDWWKTPGEPGVPVTPDIANQSAEAQSADMLRQGREVAQESLPLQISNALSTIQQLRARATGSTAELFPELRGQLGQLRAQYAGATQALSRRLGFAGGGQTTRDQGNLLSQATRQYGGMLAQRQQEGFAALTNTLSGFQPQLSGAARPASVSTSAQRRVPDATTIPKAPTDPTIYIRALQGLLGAGQATYNYFQQGSDAQNAANTIAGFRQNPAFTTGLVSPTIQPVGDDFGYTGLAPGTDYYGS